MKKRIFKNPSRAYVVGTVLFSTVVMCLVDGVFALPYWHKSAVKILLFLLIPFAYFLLFKEKAAHLKSIFRPKGKNMGLAIVLGAAVFAVVLGAYFLLGDFIDLTAIQKSLTSGVGVTAENFLFVALYISFVNSLLEEFFFRGFAFLILKKEWSRGAAYWFSSFAFAFYHAGMTDGWFSFFIYILAMLGLGAGGFIFNYLNETGESIYPSWIVHMCANFAINTVGLILFGII